MKEKNKTILFGLLAFFIPLVLYSLSFYIQGLFTNKMFLNSDGLSQFYPTYKYLYDVMHGTATFPYTFSKGIGGSMYAAFFYGLSSPTNIFIYFFKDIELFMIISTLLKISLAGLTSFIFFKKKDNSNIISLVLSLCYSLSTYVIVYNVNIMWLDAVWLLPLVLLGVEKIINNKKYLLYTITLLYSLISNYYTGYMIVLFSIIYFIYTSYINYNENNYFKNNYKKIINFLIITFFIGCSITFILLPTFLESKYFTRINLNKHIININVFDIITGEYFGMGNLSNPLNFQSLLIYCGSAITLLTIGYFTDKKIPLKERKASLIVVCIFLLPIIIIPLSYIWHIFTYPVFFNFRYGFITILFILLLASKELNKKSLNLKIIKFFIIIFIIISLSLAINTIKVPEYYIYLNYKNITITIVFMIIYYYILKKKIYNLLLIILVIDLISNMQYIFSNKYVDRINQKSNQNTYKIINNYIDKKYRFERTDDMTLNGSLLYNYMGTSVFLSSTNSNSIESIKKIKGKSNDTNYYRYTPNNYIIDSILGIKYNLYNYNNKEYNLIKQIEENNNKKYLLENKYALNLGYEVNNNVYETSDNYKNVEYINNLLNIFDNKNDNYLIELSYEKIGNNKYNIKNEKKYHFIYIKSKSYPINIDKKYLFISNYYSILYTENKNINIELNKEDDKFQVYALDMTKVKKLLKQINQVKIIENKGNNLKATIKTEKNSTIMFTIPYENNWTIIVDGKKVKYKKALYGFLAFNVDKGEHTIIMTYKVKGLNISIVISIISFIITNIILIKLKKQEK